MNITDQNRRRLIITLVIGLAAGVTFGLVYGYLINPVEWIDAPMDLTRADIQEDYLRMAIDSYKLYVDPMDAYRRWQELGDAAPKALERVLASPGVQGVDAVDNYKKLVTPPSGPAVAACPEVTPGTNNNTCIYLWLGTVVFGGGAGAYFYTRLRRQIAPQTARRYPAPKVKAQEPKPITIPFNQYPVMVHTMMTYVMGDDLFDESLSVEDELGEFLGECGIGIVHAMDEDTPKKVNGLDIWLFDKNEINTKTVVLMSEDAYNNEVLFKQMKTKGQPILAEIGREISLQTSNLVMSVRVVDMLCEEVEPMNCTFFQRLTMEVFVRKLT